VGEPTGEKTFSDAKAGTSELNQNQLERKDNHHRLISKRIWAGEVKKGGARRGKPRDGGRKSHPHVALRPSSLENAWEPNKRTSAPESDGTESLSTKRQESFGIAGGERDVVHETFPAARPGEGGGERIGGGATRGPPPSKDNLAGANEKRGAHEAAGNLGARKDERRQTQKKSAAKRVENKVGTKAIKAKCVTRNRKIV